MFTPSHVINTHKIALIYTFIYLKSKLCQSQADGPQAASNHLFVSTSSLYSCSSNNMLWHYIGLSPSLPRMAAVALEMVTELLGAALSWDNARITYLSLT